MWKDILGLPASEENRQKLILIRKKIIELFPDFHQLDMYYNNDEFILSYPSQNWDNFQRAKILVMGVYSTNSF